jgi:hypothetical protein
MIVERIKKLHGLSPLANYTIMEGIIRGLICICLKGLTKHGKPQDGQCSNEDSNLSLPRYVRRITVWANLFDFLISCLIRQPIMNTYLVQGLTFLNTAVLPILIHFHLSSSYGADPRTKKFGLNCLGIMDTWEGSLVPRSAIEDSVINMKLVRSEYAPCKDMKQKKWYRKKICLFFLSTLCLWG